MRCDDEMQKAVVKRIEKLCRQMGMSIHQLANQSGLPPSTIKNVMYGASKNTGVSTLAMICKGLEISLEDFFADEMFTEIQNKEE